MHPAIGGIFQRVSVEDELEMDKLLLLLFCRLSPHPLQSSQSMLSEREEDGSDDRGVQKGVKHLMCYS